MWRTRSSRRSRAAPRWCARKSPVKAARRAARLVACFARRAKALVVERVALFRLDECAPVGRGVPPLPAISLLVRHVEYFADLHECLYTARSARRSVVRHLIWRRF